jgi:glucosamine--fructose-6-phosphate aminotransferase (isomerizing)
VGCGSSFYIALVAAATWCAVMGGKSRAVPASELLLFPSLLPGDPSSYQPVLISRSGRTSEVLRAGEFFERQQDVRTLAITCARSTPLGEISAATIALPAADERSTVMTRSFTAMLLALQGLAAASCSRSGLEASLGSLPAQVEPSLEDWAARLRDFVETHEFHDYVFLGQGPYFGVAAEAALKVTEMSRSYAQFFHTLEFRHGPKSIVGPETLVTFFLSECGFEAERSVLEEVKSLGGTTLVVANRADQKTRGAADLLLELGLSVPETIRPAAAVIPGQLLGCYTGLKKGHDPDRPRHLSRVVVLDEGR